jgi:hypothetical protein
MQPTLNDSTRYSIRYEERLAMALNFNLDDLTANRLGAITGRQANRMRTHMLNDARQIVIALVIGLVVTVLLVALRGSLTTSAESQGFIGTLLLILIAVVAIGTLAFIVQRALSAYHFYKDTQSLRSATAQGFLSLEGAAIEQDVPQKRRWNIPHFYAAIDGKRYSISATAFLAMKKGEPYVLYYAPMSKYLLSAERLRNEREFSNNSSARAPGRAEVQLSRS